jgi:hypothetical protein
MMTGAVLIVLLLPLTVAVVLPTTAIVAVPARGNDAEKAPAALALD